MQERTNAVNNVVTLSATPAKVLDYDSDRTFLEIYAKSGAVQYSFSDGSNFAADFITIPEGNMYVPNIR
jgi:hypothetical protein